MSTEAKQKKVNILVKRPSHDTTMGERMEIVSVNGHRQSLKCEEMNQVDEDIAAEYLYKLALREMSMKNMKDKKDKTTRLEAQVNN